MVVDVDDGCVCRDLLHAAPRPLQVAGVKKEGKQCIESMRWLFFDVVKAGQKFVHGRQRWRDEHPHLLACRFERLRKRKAAAKRVPIRILVAEDEDLVVGIDEILDLVELVVNSRLGGGYGVPSSPSVLVVVTAGGRTSFSSSAMWTLYSIDGSSSKRRSGENLRFCSRRPSSWRMRPLADTSPASDSFFCSGFPSTLTRTHADLRSGDMRTAVMLTNPIRGSLSSRRMMDMISSRTCSPTWSAR